MTLIANHNSITPTGRFAPSPSGHLHLGSLVAATASYLNVKQRAGQWLLRIDDLDPPRVVAQSISHIQYQLEAYGFEWNRCIFQSQRLPIYQAALDQLWQQRSIYYCQCTRQQITQRTGRSGFYDQHCRQYHLTDHPNHSIRIKTPQEPWQWYDHMQGEQYFHWHQALGDFIVKRSDGIFAYHLACAIDDADFGITEVVRGMDLCAATAPQQWIQHQLALNTPNYAHHTLIYDTYSGIKLSKASHAPAIQPSDAVHNLWYTLSVLQQSPPEALKQANLHELWQWAIAHWQLPNKQHPIPVSTYPLD